MRNGEPAAAPNRQIVDGGRTGVAGVDDDVHFVGQHAIEGDHGVVVAHTRTVEGRGLQFFVGHHIRHAQAGRPPMPGQRFCQHGQRRAQIVGMNVGARQVRRRRADRERAHGRQRIVEAGARGHREPGAHDQAQPAAGHGSGHTRVAHDTGHSQRRRGSATRCSGYILSIGHACHLCAQQGAQRFEFPASVVTGHLLTGDDRDRSVGSAQRARNRMKVTDARLRPLNAIEYMTAIPVDVHLGLLNIFG
jgi:hypothetical protein